VLGTAGRFWRAQGELCATSPVRSVRPPRREPRRRHGTSGRGSGSDIVRDGDITPTIAERIAAMH